MQFIDLSVSVEDLQRNHTATEKRCLFEAEATFVRKRVKIAEIKLKIFFNRLLIRCGEGAEE